MAPVTASIIHGYSSRAVRGVPQLVACHIISRHYKSRAKNNMAVGNQLQWQTLFSNNLAFLAQLRRKFAKYVLTYDLIDRILLVCYTEGLRVEACFLVKVGS